MRTVHRKPCGVPHHIVSLAVAIALLAAAGEVVAGTVWRPADGPLRTRWAADVSPANALPEYPRPTMVREAWLNLNGLWDYGIVARAAPQPAAWDGQILVPYPVESALSGYRESEGLLADVVAAERRALDVKERLARLRRDHAQALAEIAYLTGDL